MQYGEPRSVNSCIQRFGRCARPPDLEGDALLLVPAGRIKQLREAVAKALEALGTPSTSEKSPPLSLTASEQPEAPLTLATTDEAGTSDSVNEVAASSRADTLSADQPEAMTISGSDIADDIVMSPAVDETMDDIAAPSPSDPVPGEQPEPEAMAPPETTDGDVTSAPADETDETDGMDGMDETGADMEDTPGSALTNGQAGGAEEAEAVLAVSTKKKRGPAITNRFKRPAKAETSPAKSILKTSKDDVKRMLAHTGCIRNFFLAYLGQSPSSTPPPIGRCCSYCSLISPFAVDVTKSTSNSKKRKNNAETRCALVARLEEWRALLTNRMGLFMNEFVLPDAVLSALADAGPLIQCPENVPPIIASCNLGSLMPGIDREVFDVIHEFNASAELDSIDDYPEASTSSNPDNSTASRWAKEQADVAKAHALLQGANVQVGEEEPATASEIAKAKETLEKKERKKQQNKESKRRQRERDAQAELEGNPRVPKKGKGKAKAS